MRLLVRLFVLVSILFISNLAHAYPRVILDGDFVQGGLVLGHAAPGASVMLGDKTIRVDKTGRFLIGFGRVHPVTAQLTITHQSGAQEVRTLSVAQREYNIQRVEGVPQSRVTPPPEGLGRIKEEGKIKRAARSQETESKGYDATFNWPAHGPITGVYGSQRVYNGTPKNPHFGVDIGAPTGTEVVAPAPGIVTLAEPDMYFEGGLIFVDHGMGLVSVFMHLSSVDTEVGKAVRQGDSIGKIGATGRVTGPHLDWRMYWTDQRVDPALLVGPMEIKKSETARGG